MRKRNRTIQWGRPREAYRRAALGTSVYVDDLDAQSLRELLEDVPRDRRVELYRTVQTGRYYARRWVGSGTVVDNSPALACIAPDRSPEVGGSSEWWVFVDVDRLDDGSREQLHSFLAEAEAAGEACYAVLADPFTGPSPIVGPTIDDVRRAVGS